MAVSSYEKDGKIYWQAYVAVRSRKKAGLRLQKRVTGLASEREALAKEKQLLRDLTEQLGTTENRGESWNEIIERWLRHQELYPSKKYAKNTIIDYAATARKWTTSWLARPASELNRGDGREIDCNARDAGKSSKFRKNLKSIINMIYTWGIEERIIKGVHQSPMYGLEIERDREEKRPEILTKEEIRTLLQKAREQRHPWYPVWVAAVLTGCRSGELHQLRRADLDVISREAAIEEDKKPFDKRRYGFLRVRKSWNTRGKQAGPTKAGYWRTVPVSSEFYWFLVHDLRIEEMKADSFLLPRHWEWDQGSQASILRMFCQANKLPSVRFHTLRACFATQLISTGVPATVVMKICGWRDMKTMQRYIRLAGIDEGGATETLRFIPTEEAVMEKVVNLFDHRKNSEESD